MLAGIQWDDRAGAQLHVHILYKALNARLTAVNTLSPSLHMMPESSSGEWVAADAVLPWPSALSTYLFTHPPTPSIGNLNVM